MNWLQFPTPFVLVLDDFHVIQSEEVLKSVPLPYRTSTSPDARGNPHAYRSPSSTFPPASTQPTPGYPGGSVTLYHFGDRYFSERYDGVDSFRQRSLRHGNTHRGMDCGFATCSPFYARAPKTFMDSFRPSPAVITM